MNAKFAFLRSEVLALPAEDSAALAADLLASLDGDLAGADPTEVDLAWADEMARRSEQIVSGEVPTLSWSEVLEQIAASRGSR